MWLSNGLIGPNVMPNHLISLSEAEINHGWVLFGLCLARRAARCGSSSLALSPQDRGWCHVAVALARWGSGSPSVGSECAPDRGMHLGALFHLEPFWSRFLHHNPKPMWLFWSILPSSKSTSQEKAAVTSARWLFSASHQECCCAQLQQRDLVCWHCWQPVIDCITLLIGRTAMLWSQHRPVPHP